MTRKLTDDQVREIRSLRGTRSSDSVAFTFGVASSTIRRVWNYETYRDIPDLVDPEIGGLDKGSRMCYNIHMSSGTIEFDREESAKALLRPLLNGEAIVLAVSNRGMMRKKRIQYPFLSIIPGRVLGLDPGVLLFALPGYGAEIMKTSELKATWLFRLGLKMAAAKLLVKALNELFNPVTSN